MAENTKFNDFFNINDYSLLRFADSVADLPVPEDPFRGMSGHEVVPPGNILAFRGGKWLGRGSRLAPPKKGNKMEMGTTHERFMLIVPLIGDGAIILDGEVFHLELGKTILVQPHQFHRYFSTSNLEKNWLYITFGSMGSLPLNQLRNQICSMETFDLLCCERLIAGFVANRPQEVTLLLSYVLSSLLEKDHPFPKKSLLAKPKHHNDMQDVIELISENLHQTLSVEWIAKKVALSPSRLRTKFRETTGISLGRYIREHRHHSAAISLKTSNESIGSISEKVGFDSIYSFSRSFKMETGLSPQQYRNKVRPQGKEI